MSKSGEGALQSVFISDSSIADSGDDDGEDEGEGSDCDGMDTDSALLLGSQVDLMRLRN